MKTFTEKDTNLMTWEEVEALIEILIRKISRYFDGRNEPLTVISPMLRTGGIVGGILSIKMRIVTMLPVQFKYSHTPTCINQVTSIPEILGEMPECMNVLLCEGNTSSGSTAKKAALAIKEKFPSAKIYLATLTKVFGCDEKLDGVEEIFYGRMTDENFQATEKEKMELDLRPGITIFPWENPTDELSDINAGQISAEIIS